jgi:hypothetical protein
VGQGTVGLGHEPQSLSDVRSADARSWQIGRRDGVACSFQVSCHVIEPCQGKARLNLLTKQDCRSALADESEPWRP